MRSALTAMVERSRRGFENCKGVAMKVAQTRQAFYSDRRRHDPELKVGDQDLVHRQFLLTLEARDRPSDKLRPRWYGPFKITQVINNNTFRLDLPH